MNEEPIAAVHRQTAYNRPEAKFAWKGPSVLILDNAGWSGTGDFQGYFFRETRYLHDLRLELNGEAPFPCSIGKSGADAIQAAYVYPEPAAGAGQEGIDRHRGFLYRDLHLDLSYRLHPASIEVELRIGSAWERVELDLAWILSADFVDPDAAKREERQLDAGVESHPERNGVRFRLAHQAFPLETHISVTGGGEWVFSEGQLRTRLSIARQEIVEIRLRIRAVDVEDRIDERGERDRERRLNEWLDRVTRVSAPGESPLVEITNHAAQDLGSLALLEGPEEEWLAPTAGMPVFGSVWGRDALTAAWQCAVFDRGDMAASVLAKLAGTQGSEVDPERDEEPGRIIRQIRSTLPTRLGRSSGIYYGDFASPFMFIITLGNAYAWSGDRRLLARHWDTAERVLAWATEFGDMDGDGYLEYQTRSKAGPKHQGWKDSDDAIVDGAGRQVGTPIAPSEIQGYWFAALQFMAVFAELLGKRKHGYDLWKRAGELKERFNRDFWIEEEGTVGLGLDSDKRLIRSVTSNAGHCLATGIIESERLPRLVQRLFEPDMFSGWGIRTLSTKNPAYHPLSYHLGSVWPVENASILFGLRRFGFNERSQELAAALYDLARIWSDRRTPECVGGFSRADRPQPGAYPQANSPQTWNQSAFPLLVQTLLGLQPVAPLHLLGVDPLLPHWLPEITLKNLRVGDARVILRFWRDKDGDSHHEVVEREGKLRIVHQPPLNALDVGFWDRLKVFAKGLAPF